jgi:hypothetical protein
MPCATKGDKAAGNHCCVVDRRFLVVFEVAL